MKGALGVLLGACCAVAIACGGVQSKSAAPTTAAAPGRSDPRAEIEELDRQIAEQLTRAQVPRATATCTGAACTQAMNQPFTTPAMSGPQCHPASSAKCSDACTLATSICSNQQKICDLAKQLEGDDWAAGKCESARASCRAAHDNCCSCLL